MRRCRDCDKDISRRHYVAFLCQGCALERQIEREHRIADRRKKDPDHQARYRTYHREWHRKKFPRLTRIRTCVCGCGKTFDATSGGRTRVYHPECAAFFRRDLKNASGRRWYAKNRERELLRGAVYRAQRLHVQEVADLNTRFVRRKKMSISSKSKRTHIYRLEVKDLPKQTEWWNALAAKYPNVDLDEELLKAQDWHRADSVKSPKLYFRNWVDRASQSAPRVVRELTPDELRERLRVVA